jgi:hypothetical protein
MSEQERPPTEEEMRAAYEAELKRVRVDDVIVQTVVSLVNLGGRKAGLAPGTEDERDLAQVRQAIEATREMVYAQGAGGAPGGGSTPGGEGQQPPPAQPGQPGQAQSSGRLWVPGQ